MTKQSFEHRSSRRDRLLGLLRSEDYWKTAELSQQLGVSQRTIMRELADLRDAGYPIESDRGRGGGIRLSGRWGIERLQLNHQELIELIVALAVMENLRSPLLAGNLKAIQQKLFQAFPSKQRSAVSKIRRRILIGNQATSEVLSQYVKPSNLISEQVSESFLMQKCIEIDYQTGRKEKTTRVIEIHYILLSWPIWYVVAWDHLRSAARTFRVDRIRGSRPIEGHFKHKSKSVFEASYGNVFSSI